MLDTSGLIDALITEPVSFRDVVKAWLEAIGMVAFVTPIAKQQRILVVPTMAKLTKRLHD